MAYLDKFNILVGDTLMHSQRIEHDIKIIYAAMLKGEMADNLELVRRETLGAVLVALQELDNSDNKPMFTDAEYKTLKEIKNIRNYIAHQSYVDFLYSPEEEFTEKISKTYEKITFFNKKLKNISTLTENLRFSVLLRYGRI